MSYLSGIGLAACGRVVLGLPACLPRPRTFGCGSAALWGRQSCLQPPFRRLFWATRESSQSASAG